MFILIFKWGIFCPLEHRINSGYMPNNSFKIYSFLLMSYPPNKLRFNFQILNNFRLLLILLTETVSLRFTSIYPPNTMLGYSLFIDLRNISNWKEIKKSTL